MECQDLVDLKNHIMETNKIFLNYVHTISNKY